MNIITFITVFIKYKFIYICIYIYISIILLYVFVGGEVGLCKPKARRRTLLRQCSMFPTEDSQKLKP